MNVHRRGFAHRLTALVLAFAMPMCCCVVNTLTGGGCCGDRDTTQASAEPCIAATAAPAASCCMQEATPNDTPAPCDKAGTCICCIKVPGPVYEWAVPVDRIGTPIVDVATACTVTSMATEALAFDTRRPNWDDLPLPWQRIAAGCGHTILHC